MPLTAQHTRLAVTIDRHVNQVVANGGGDKALWRSMADHMGTFKPWLETCSGEEMDLLCQPYDGFYRLANLPNGLRPWRKASPMARPPFRPKDEPSWLGELLSHETCLIWLLDPVSFASVRQAAIVTRNPSGPPSDDRGGTRLLVGYREVRERGRGVYRRRIFDLRDTDRDLDPLGAYRDGAPAEAVDPMTGVAGKV